MLAARHDDDDDTAVWLTIIYMTITAFQTPWPDQRISPSFWFLSCSLCSQLEQLNPKDNKYSFPLELTIGLLFWSGWGDLLVSQSQRILCIPFLGEILVYADHHYHRTISTIIPDPLSSPHSIVHCFRQVFMTTSRIGTELLCVDSGWSSCICSAMWRGPQECITYELIPTSPAVFHMSGSSNFDSFRDGW